MNSEEGLNAKVGSSVLIVSPWGTAQLLAYVMDIGVVSHRQCIFQPCRPIIICSERGLYEVPLNSPYLDADVT